MVADMKELDCIAVPEIFSEETKNKEISVEKLHTNSFVQNEKHNVRPPHTLL